MGYQEAVLCGPVNVPSEFWIPVIHCNASFVPIVTVKFNFVENAYGMRCNGTNSCDVVIVPQYLLMGMSTKLFYDSGEKCGAMNVYVNGSMNLFLPPAVCWQKNNFFCGDLINYCYNLSGLCTSYCDVIYVHFDITYGNLPYNVKVIPPLVRFEYYSTCIPNSIVN